MAIGIDLGRTNLKGVLLNEQGEEVETIAFDAFSGR